MSKERMKGESNGFNFYQESMCLASRVKESADLAVEADLLRQRGLRTEEIQQLFLNAAGQLISAEDFQNASEILAIFPRDSWFTLSYDIATKMAITQGKLEEVLSLTEECGRKFSTITPFQHTSRAEALVRLGRKEEMEQEWIELIQASPKNIKSAALAALRLWRAGFHADCQKIWDRLLATYPTERATHICFAKLLEEQKQYDALAQCWQYILQIFPDDDAKNQCFFTAVRLTEDGVDQNIIAIFEKLVGKKVELHHASGRATSNLRGGSTVNLETGRKTRVVRTHLREEKYEDVVAVLKDMTSKQEVTQQEYNLCMSTALQLLQRGAVGEAMILWEELIAIQDAKKFGLVTGCGTFIRRLIAQNYEAQTLRMFNRYQARYPSQAKALLRTTPELRGILSPTRRNGSAPTSRDTAKPLPPSRLTISVHLLHLGRVDEAMQTWESFDNADAEACAKFATLLEQEGKSAQAEALWGKIYTVAPSLRLAYTCDVLQRTGKFRYALPHLQASLPTVEQKQLSRLNWEALEVYAYCAGLSPGHARHPFEQLLVACERARLITPQQAKRLRHKADRILEESRGDKIEESLKGYGAYARSKAFRVLIEQKPHLRFADTQTRRVMTNSP